MPETITPQVPAPAPATPAPATALDWQHLFDTLFPEGRHVARDVMGCQYTLRTVLPARREAELVRKLGELARLPAGQHVAQLGSAASGSGADLIGSLLATVAKLAAEEDVLRLLCEAVEIAHPGLRAAVTSSWCSLDDARGLVPTSGPVDLADAFDTTELVQCLLPFVLRPASKVMGLLDKLSQPGPTT